MLNEKLDLGKQLQTTESELTACKKERDELQQLNKVFDDRLKDAISGEDNQAILEVYAKEIANMKVQRKLEMDTLRGELLKQKDKCREAESKLQQRDSKVQDLEMKIRNLEAFRRSKDSDETRSPQKAGGKVLEDLELDLHKVTKELSLNNIKCKRLEDQNAGLRKELEEKCRMIKDQDSLIKDLKCQLQESAEVNHKKLTQRESEIRVLQKDVDFTNKKLEDEVRKNNRAIKAKEIEIERLQDKVQMLELKTTNSPDDPAPEKGKVKFNYEAHWVIEENLRERISELKKELNSQKEANEKLTAERDSMESQLIRVKTEWAMAELEREQNRY